MLSNQLNALALLSRANDLASKAAFSVPKSTRDVSSPPTLDIPSSQLEALQKQLRHQIQRHQALAEMRQIETAAAEAARKGSGIARPPLVERIMDFPTPGVPVDTANLVTYPPRLQPIPVKPLFFDVAFNYLEYPGQAKKAVERQAAAAPVEVTTQASPKPDEKKRGWFGFGR